MTTKGLIAVLFISLISLHKISAQSCAEVLNHAREDFTAGHLYGIPASLKACLDNGFNKDQRIEAYWLLTRTYLLIDDPIGAEDSYLKLLKLDPEYNIDPDRDPIDVVYLSRKFKTTPIFVIYAKGGFNMSSVSVIHNYGMDNTTESNESYKNKLGLHVGGGGELNFSNRVSLGLEINLHTRKYSYSNTLFNTDQQTFEEAQIGLDLPIYIKYRWDFDKFRPYVYAGFGMDYLLQAKATVKLVDRVNAGTEDLTEIPVAGPQVTINEQRTRLTEFTHFGVGLNYRFGYNYIVIDLRYKVGLSNIVSEEGQYSNSTLLYKYGFVDDDKRINNYAVSIGFVKPLYKPRKIKTSSRGFLSRLFSKGS